ncbi:hypothetical protein [Streptomyces sp. NBC_00523]|uniref:hypothetical protein n=1 Tax=unclassified Streptomyces TaxID=2593676 RepID=UPI002E80754A|nr:hypothetical protein [Streptomyces sp. NBC_00523]WUD03760.1 hypothetical protein OHS17_30745 [Streptomyces sp. NBC_00523]
MLPRSLPRPPHPGHPRYAARGNACARVALAGSARGRVAGYPLLSATSGPVPRRVEALLLPEPAPPRGGVRRIGVVALAASVVAAAVTALAVAFGLHEYVEFAARRLICGEAA